MCYRRNKKLFNRFLKFGSKKTTGGVTITCHNHGHHKKPWKDEIDVAMSLNYRDIIPDKFSKNREIEYRRNNGWQKCLFPNTQEARNFFVGQGVEVSHGNIFRK